MKKVWKTAGILSGAMVLAVLLRSWVATPYLIPSAGMENSLYRGERILVNKWSYGLRLPWMRLWGYHRWRERPVGKEDIVVFNNPANLSCPVVDRREVFIGRCTGRPGDTLLVDSLFTVIPSERQAPDQKFLYAYPRALEERLDSLLRRLSIRNNEVLGRDSAHHVRSFSRYEYYLLEQAMDGTCWIEPVDKRDSSATWYPLVIPAKGQDVQVFPWNRALLYNTLLLHEGRQAEIRHDTLYVEGKPVEHCRFTKDYHWVTSNNPTNLSDSRLFGFVPKDHIIGRASLVWFSKEEGTGLSGGFRWERMGRPVK